MTTTYDVVNPANEQVVRTVQLADVEETDRTIARAVEAQRGWAALAPADRAALQRATSSAVSSRSAAAAESTTEAARRAPGMGRTRSDSDSSHASTTC